jgi:hypothetical protein
MRLNVEGTTITELTETGGWLHVNSCLDAETFEHAVKNHDSDSLTLFEKNKPTKEDREKIINAGFRLLAVTESGKAINGYNKSGYWDDVGDYKNKAETKRAIATFRKDPFIIFENEEGIYRASNSAPIIEDSTITLAAMTHTEAQEAHTLIKSMTSILRSLFLKMRDRRGWAALGYESFEDYGKQEFNYSQSYIYRLAAAEEIQNNLNSPIGEIPETHLRPLGSVPADERQSIYDAAYNKALDAGKALTAAQVQEAVKDWREKAEKNENWANTLEKDFDKMVTDEVASKLEDEKQELQTKFNAALSQVDGDYEEKIGNLKDTISRLQNQISDSGQTQQKLDDLNQLINTKKLVLDALQRESEDSFVQKRRDDNLAEEAEKLSKAVALFIINLRASHSHCPESVYPKIPLSPRNKSELLHAAGLFESGAEEIKLLF